MIPSVLVAEVRETILDYLRTTFAFADPDFEQRLFAFLEGPEGLFKGPYLDVRLPFRLASPGEAVPLEVVPPFRPYQHQFEAFHRLTSRRGHQPQHTLVTTGTGSGKTECFLYPILDHCLAHAGEPGVKAIVLYPMNALATDQARRLARLLWDDERLRGKTSAALYVGGRGQHGAAGAEFLIDDRDVIRQSPPDILLTNYKMLDFLLLRPEDAPLWRRNGPDSLRYLVLDELHSYDGAQGSDVACLIRRLKGRLGVAPGSLCCVGTSATMGQPGGEAGRALLEFATTVFGEHFGRDALVVEDRLEPHEALGDRLDLDQVPAAEQWPDLDPEGPAAGEGWLERQGELWTGVPATDVLQLGELLARHCFLRDLLLVLAQGPQALGEVAKRLGRRELRLKAAPHKVQQQMLASFVALISHARQAVPGDEESDTRLAPFLTVQVQLWVRELRHLVRKVAAEPQFAWEDAAAGDQAHWLPIIHCRECGGTGFGTLQPMGQQRLEEDLSSIMRGWLYRSRHCRYLIPGDGNPGEFPQWLHPDTLCLDGQEQHGGPAGMRVIVEQSVSDARPPRFLARCPECASDKALSVLGARAASLLSVAISQAFLSTWNEDKKVLAFTDSVQDASHRAGFFGARTWRFNLRAAIQDVVEHAAQDVPLEDFARRLCEHWSQKPQMELPRLYATFWPPDLRDETTYQSFMESGSSESRKRLRHKLLERLSLDVSLEYGYASDLGRSLERTLCSTAAPDPQRMAQAAELLRQDLIERELLPGIAPHSGQVRHLLEMLVLRMRRRGGVRDKLLDTYMKNDGKRWCLSKHRRVLMPPFPAQGRLPRFLSDEPHPKVFDSWKGTAARPVWLRDFAARVLGVAPAHEGLLGVCAAAIECLADAGICSLVKSRRGWVAGLEPAALLVTGRVVLLMCNTCRRRVVLPKAAASAHAGRPCLRYRCQGSLALAASQEAGYYARIYRGGRLRRIFSAEHTGLLLRKQREALEESFKSPTRPDAPNLIVCTPTLEMGIDVGDLSVAVLCSVPPAPANYLQRVGRAGRKDGNSFCLCLANHRPHDLYYEEQPQEMLAGEVLPPGCFMDAPEMLKRQLVAHAMDGWARQEEPGIRIPAKARLALGSGGAASFPGRFLAFHKQNASRLTEEFLALFGGLISQENCERLRAFGRHENVREAVLKGFQSIEQERQDLGRQMDRLRRRQQELDQAGEAGEELRSEREEVDLCLRTLRRVRGEVLSKYPLNVLTDAGALPNYAFPEPGVTLKSVMRERSDEQPRGAGKKPRYRTAEYVRPASSAIRELAPFNTFYAEGQKVHISEVDVGTRTRPLVELWRLCSACAHMERDAAKQDPRTVCPSCGNEGWQDAGQVRPLVHFKRASSFENLLEAASVDDDDERQSQQYVLHDLIDVSLENVRGARLIEDPLFGFELLQQVTLREVNFGCFSRTPGEEPIQVAGERIPAEGFHVCLDCGRVRDERRDPRLRHAAWCQVRKGAKEHNANIWLYREIASEAIRVILPVAVLDVEQELESFRAALDLGFRRKFRGRPGHLLIKSMSEPVQAGSEGRRRFLVIYDGVPGGTGYLSSLWQQGEFLEVLELARGALLACPCRDDPGKDGCYRCLYAYQRQASLKKISRRRALALLERVLARREAFTSVPTLSAVRLELQLESELESRFVAALQNWASTSEHGSSAPAIRRGKECVRFQVGERSWVLEPQVDLGTEEGVSKPSRPDFVLWPAPSDTGVLPVAVFCDGFQYHVEPDKELARLQDDVAKRQAIMASGAFVVWSVTWKDVDLFEKRGSPAPSLLGTVRRGALASALQKLACPLARRIVLEETMHMLLAYLEEPDLEAWRGAARAALLETVTRGPHLSAQAAHALEDRLFSEGSRFEARALETETSPGAVLATYVSHPWASVLVLGSKEAIGGGDMSACRALVRLFDEHEGRQDRDFEASWRAVLAGWNLLQFHPELQIITSEGLDEAVSTKPAWPALARPLPEKAPLQVADRDDPELLEALNLAAPACHELLRQCRAQGLPLPEVGYEEGGLPVELGFGGAKVAVLLEEEPPLREAFEERGWVVLCLSTGLEQILDAVASRGR